MSIAEATKRMIDSLSEAEVLEIYRHTKATVEHRDEPFELVSKKEILADLALSRKQIENGECLDFDAAMDEIGRAYGL